MNREEAIKELTDLLLEEFLSEYTEAIKMGIEALKQEPCEDCISRQAVLDLPRIKTHNVWGNVIYESVDVDAVRQLPPVSPTPKIGHWIKCIDDNGSSYYLCSVCRCGEDFKFDWCPNCGAKMSEIPTGAEGSDKE